MSVPIKLSIVRRCAEACGEQFGGEARRRAQESLRVWIIPPLLSRWVRVNGPKRGSFVLIRDSNTQQVWYRYIASGAFNTVDLDIFLRDFQPAPEVE